MSWVPFTQYPSSSSQSTAGNCQTLFSRQSRNKLINSWSPRLRWRSRRPAPWCCRGNRPFSWGSPSAIIWVNRMNHRKWWKWCLVSDMAFCSRWTNVLWTVELRVDLYFSIQNHDPPKRSSRWGSSHQEQLFFGGGLTNCFVVGWFLKNPRVKPGGRSWTVAVEVNLWGSRFVPR